ncbi:hypothetical protein DDZ18_03930 [Marinicauda salina]|uniref:JmjC domain-containing protein n=1 Tax=Marinicauda salina TaxID=2135793 RepID=A0A2U2BXL0_9PROT|nr:cupin domain-containing protein [Marinicauda salina]PWE18751.1 hypothetical protein DDZ18_03930 [Marinicauda salina]
MADDDAPAGDRAFAELIAPVAPETFFTEHHERAPLHLSGERSDRFSHLLSIAEIDRLLADEAFHDGELSMARAEPRVEPADYLLGDGRVDKGAVARLYGEGATLILPQLHRRVRPLAEFCRMLEAVFSAHVQTNIYLTPATAQGFQTHYDNHDVFVLQLEGTKRWRLYDSPAGVPFRGERFTPGQFAAGEPTAEFTLAPGDLLYIPRGLMHDAVSEAAGPSLHVTTGVLVKTWADFLLEAISEASLRTPGLRRSLPPGFARADFDRAAMEPAFRAALAEAGEAADFDAVFDLFVDNFLRSREPDIAGTIADGPPGPGTRIRRRALVQLRLADEDERHVALVAPGGPISFDRAAESGLERFLSGEPVGVADFAAMGGDKALDTLRRLLAYGAAERA